jgi:preprotein translocase subunit SecD
MKYRSVLHMTDSGATRIESIWVDDINEANRMGKSGLDFYGGTHFTIEDNSEMNLEELVKAIRNDVMQNAYDKEEILLLCDKVDLLLMKQLIESEKKA